MLRARRCVAGSHRDRRGGGENGDWRGEGWLGPEQRSGPERAGAWQPKDLRCSSPAAESVPEFAIAACSSGRSRWPLPGLVGPRSAAVQCIGKWRGWRLYRLLPGRTATTMRSAGCQTRTGMNKFHPRGVAVQGASCRFLISESGEPSHVTPVGAGGITSISARQPLAGSGRHRRFQREQTEANPGFADGEDWSARPHKDHARWRTCPRSRSAAQHPDRRECSLRFAFHRRAG